MSPSCKRSYLYGPLCAAGFSKGTIPCFSFYLSGVSSRRGEKICQKGSWSDCYLNCGVLYTSWSLIYIYLCKSIVITIIVVLVTFIVSSWYFIKNFRYAGTEAAHNYYSVERFGANKVNSCTCCLLIAIVNKQETIVEFYHRSLQFFLIHEEWTIFKRVLLFSSFNLNQNSFGFQSKTES